MRSAKTVSEKVSRVFEGIIRCERTLLNATEEGSVLLQAEVDFDEVSAGEKLHDHSRRNDRCDFEFHESTTIRSEDDTRKT